MPCSRQKSSIINIFNEEPGNASPVLIHMWWSWSQCELRGCPYKPQFLSGSWWRLRWWLSGSLAQETRVIRQKRCIGFIKTILIITVTQQESNMTHDNTKGLRPDCDVLVFTTMVFYWAGACYLVNFGLNSGFPVLWSWLDFCSRGAQNCLLCCWVTLFIKNKKFLL